MKLSLADKLLLTKLLSNVVLYKETYEEVYDHVLTAIEERAGVVNVHKEAFQILEEDFGGYTGIAKMEKYRIKFVEADFYLKYASGLKASIRNPLVVVVLIAIAAGYYAIGSVYRESSLIPPAIGFIISVSPWAFTMMMRQVSIVKTAQLKAPITVETVANDKLLLLILVYVAFAAADYFARMFCWNNGFRLAERVLDVAGALLFIAVLLNFFVFFKVYYSKTNSFN